MPHLIGVIGTTQIMTVTLRSLASFLNHRNSFLVLPLYLSIIRIDKNIFDFRSTYSCTRPIRSNENSDINSTGHKTSQ
jgi:hypothetical protein